MARGPSHCGWKIANQLKGQTLREILALDISIAFQCDACDRTAVWLCDWVKREQKLQPLMSKQIHEFADKLRCVNCQAQTFYVRPARPSDGNESSPI